jgi:hypothetical protein
LIEEHEELQPPEYQGLRMGRGEKWSG